MNKTAVVLINTGTPDNPSTGDVRRYLREFLGDGRVITIPSVFRKLLVNGIITPFRAPKSAALYKKVWTSEGSPLLTYTQKLAKKLQNLMGEDYLVIVGMRYGSPSLKEALDFISQNNIPKVILVPLYPQYASSTTGSALELAFSILQKQNVIPQIKTVGQFYNHPGFVECFESRVKLMEPEKYDHILFSYHSLPLSHVKATHNGRDCTETGCLNEVNDVNRHCYQAACYATTRLIAERTNIAEGRYTVCFQSRFSKNWVSPFADDVIVAKAKEGIKKLLVVSPAFVTDCLETITEIGDGYSDLFLANGGQKLDMVYSLNDSDDWAKVLLDIIMAH
jgi:protoporphyrin/coproporphyrin ferrochelatase